MKLGFIERVAGLSEEEIKEWSTALENNPVFMAMMETLYYNQQSSMNLVKSTQVTDIGS